VWGGVDNDDSLGDADEDASVIGATSGGGAMWPWIIGLVSVMAVMVFVMTRRGSTGASRAEDRNSTHTVDESKGLGGGAGGGSAF
jgi:hypothetical protein